MKPLGELELSVMKVLWAGSGSLTVRQVLEALSQDRALAYTTVLTVLDHLFQKKFVSRERTGRAFAYQWRISQADYSAGLIAHAVEASPDKSRALLHFFDRLDSSEVQRLRRALDAAEGGAVGTENAASRADTSESEG